jgi:hypothetical protein
MANTGLSRFLRSQRGFWTIFALAAAPMTWGLLSRLKKHNHLFADFYQLSCAAARQGAHLPLYDHSACPGMDAMPFVYIAPIAHISAVLTGWLGAGGFTAFYVVLYVAAGVALLWKLIFSKTIAAPPVERAPMLVLITGSAVSWGNIALPLAALIAVAAETVMSAPVLFCAAVAVATAVKPTYLVYLLGVLYAPLSLVRRGVLVGLTAAAGLAPTLLFIMLGGAEAQQWLAQTTHYVLYQAPGFGFLGWTAALHIPGTGGVVSGVFLLYAALIAAAGWLVAARGGLGAVERVWLGLGVAPLLIPRLMRYDAFLLGMGMILTAKAAQAISPGFGPRAAPALYGLFGVCWVLNAAVGGNQLLLVTPLFSLALILLAVEALKIGQLKAATPAGDVIDAVQAPQSAA